MPSLILTTLAEMVVKMTMTAHRSVMMSWTRKVWKGLEDWREKEMIGPPLPAKKRDRNECIPDQGDQVEGGGGQDEGEDEMPEEDSQEEPDDEDGK